MTKETGHKGKHRGLAQCLILLLWLGGSGPYRSYAQSCTGVLGGAVVNQTFGSDGPYALQPGQTTYKPAAVCPNDGEYLIARGYGCYSDSWFLLSEDHTPGDVKGNMLIVNASEDPGEFYRQSVPGLCNGTTYEFSVWIINLLFDGPTNGCNQFASVPLDPNILMRVELPTGQVLQTLKTGTVPRTNTATWVRYATVFTLPAGQNTVVIKLINNGPGGCGNDLALDDIQLRPCRPPLQIQFRDANTTTLAVCEGSATPLRSALGPGYSNPAYQWQVSTDSLVWQALAGADGPTYNAPATGPGKTYYRLLSAPESAGAATWDTTCSTVSNPLTVQTLHATACSLPQFYVPDAFTPNNDGINDRFRVDFSEGIARLARFQLRVYDRWGAVIFTGDALNQEWDGTFTAQPCSGDVYSWVIDCQLAYASEVFNFTKQGRVLLIR